MIPGRDWGQWRALLLAVCLATSAQAAQHNVLVCITDAFDPSALGALTPTLDALRARGVTFSHGRAVEPTELATAAATLATGHYPGDTGVFGDVEAIGYRAFRSGNFGRSTGTLLPNLKSDAVLGDLDDAYGGNVLNETSWLAAARAGGWATAAVGAAGLAALQDVGPLTPKHGRFAARPGLLVDELVDLDGPSDPELRTALRAAGLPLRAPAGQETQYFLDVATRAVLPLLRQRGRPFVLVYWLRGATLADPAPGPAVLDAHVHQLLAALDTAPSVLASTDVWVVSARGARPAAAPAASVASPPADAPPSAPVPLALALGRALRLPVYDPDHTERAADGTLTYTRLDGPASGQSASVGQALIGGSARPVAPSDASWLVASGPGTELLYALHEDSKLVHSAVELIAQRTDLRGIWVDDRFGNIGGALPMSTLRLVGSGLLPRPSIVVTYAAPGAQRLTHLLMLVAGPDFKERFDDPLPVGPADLAPTMAQVLGLAVSTRGTHTGRVLSEAMRGENSAQILRAESCLAISPPAADERRTVLSYRRFGQRDYVEDSAFARIEPNARPGCRASPP